MVTLNLTDSAFIAGGSASYAVAFDTGAATGTLAPVTLTGTVQITIPTWWLLVPSQPALNTPIQPKKVRVNTPITAVVVEQYRNTLVAATPPLAAHINMEIWIKSAAEKAKVRAALECGEVIRIISVLNETWDVRLVSGIDDEMQAWAPLPGETTPLRDAHVFTVAFTEQSMVSTVGLPII